VKFIVDANLSPRIAARLCEHGHDAVAVRDVGLLHASDDEILARAIADGRVIVSLTRTSERSWRSDACKDHRLSSCVRQTRSCLTIRPT
jgi:hypothetical protein